MENWLAILSISILFLHCGWCGISEPFIENRCLCHHLWLATVQVSILSILIGFCIACDWVCVLYLHMWLAVAGEEVVAQWYSEESAYDYSGKSNAGKSGWFSNAAGLTSVQSFSEFGFCSHLFMVGLQPSSLMSTGPQVVWCHWGEIGPLSATLAQDGMAECNQPGRDPAILHPCPFHGSDHNCSVEE